MDIKLSSNMEDYLKVICELEKKRGAARVKDIAEKLNITMPSVSAALKNLEKQGLVCHPRYDLVGLSKKGKKIAEDIIQRHHVIKEFLFDILGVDETIAERDACHIEHHVSPETVQRLVQFMTEEN